MLTIILQLKYRTPNHSNDRRSWFAIVKEKHKAQAELLLSLRSAASAYLTHAPNTEAARLLSTASDTLASYTMTARKTSRLKSIKKKFGTSKMKKR